MAAYITLCVPDLHASLQRTFGRDAAIEQLNDAAERAEAVARPATYYSDGKPYPRGRIARTHIGGAIVLTTRNSAGEPLCLVEAADGTASRSWSDGRHELCPASVALPLPSGSPVRATPGCGDARCLLAQVESALWRCASESGTPEGCQEPDKLRAVGRLDPQTPVVAWQASPPQLVPHTARVNTSALLEGTVNYTINAADEGALWTLSYYSATQERAVLMCEGAGCPAPR